MLHSKCWLLWPVQWFPLTGNGVHYLEKVSPWKCQFVCLLVYGYVQIGIASKKFHMNRGTWAIEAEPIGSTSNLSNISVILWPNSFSSTSWMSVNRVAGARSHRVTSLLTHAAGAKSGFPTIWATWFAAHIQDVYIQKSSINCHMHQNSYHKNYHKLGTQLDSNQRWS